MHAFVTAVLLRSAGLDAFVHDAQFGPADRQLGQPEEPAAGERGAIVGPDSGWHSVLTHCRFANRCDLVQVHA